MVSDARRACRAPRSCAKACGRVLLSLEDFLQNARKVRLYERVDHDALLILGILVQFFVLTSLQEVVGILNHLCHITCGLLESLRRVLVHWGKECEPQIGAESTTDTYQPRAAAQYYGTLRRTASRRLSCSLQQAQLQSSSVDRCCFSPKGGFSVHRKRAADGGPLPRSMTP